MVKNIRIFTVILLSWLSVSSCWAAGFSAHVDRNQISEQDSFSLVLRYDAQAFMSEPDTSALTKDFRILNQQRSQQFRSVNGQTESFTNWILTLTPLRTGTLTIPSINYDGEQTQPIEITVVPLSEEAKQQAEQDFFFETKAEPSSGLVVQGQVLYTEKLFYRYQHENPSLSELKVTDAKVLPLGEIRQYSTVINGVQFGVYERQYSIFPEVSGELVIPGARFNANVVDRYSWGRGRPVKAHSQPLKFNVAAIPTSYPKNAEWLPAQKLVLEEQFSTPPSQWQLGEAITRTFTISAYGSSGNRLPAIKLPVVAGVRYYPDQIKTDDQFTDTGVMGRSQQAVAMVVTQAGTLVLPEVRIPWWNTQTNQLEYAVLPAHTLEIKATGAATASQPTAEASTPSTPTEFTLPASTTTNDTTAPAAPLLSLPSYREGGIALLLLLSIGINLWLWRHNRHSKDLRSTAVATPSQNQYWHAFSHACNSAPPTTVRQTLLAWVNAGGFSHIDLPRPIASLTLLATAVDTPALSLALRGLDATLYAPNGNSAFNAQQLKTLVEQENQRSNRQSQQQQNLYPA